MAIVVVIMVVMVIIMVVMGVMAVMDTILDYFHTQSSGIPMCKYMSYINMSYNLSTKN
jgi:hypothetical protein